MPEQKYKIIGYVRVRVTGIVTAQNAIEARRKAKDELKSIAVEARSYMNEEHLESELIGLKKLT